MHQTSPLSLIVSSGERVSHDWADAALDKVLGHSDLETRLKESVFRGCHAARNHFPDHYPTARELGLQTWLDVGYELYEATKPLGWAPATPRGQRIYVPSSDLIPWCSDLLFFRADSVTPATARRFGVNTDIDATYFRLYPNRRVNTKTRILLQGHRIAGGQYRTDIEMAHQPIKHKTLCLLYETKQIYDNERNTKDFDVFVHLAVPKALSSKGVILECSRSRMIGHMPIGQMPYGVTAVPIAPTVTITPVISPAKESSG